MYVRPEWFDERPLEEQLARWSIGFALLLLIIPLALARIDFGNSDEITRGFVGLPTLTTVLFAAGGTAIALAVRGYARTISKLYAFDLAGAALGAVAVVPLMWPIKVPALLVALGPVAAIAALLFIGDLRGVLARAALP